MKLVHKDYPIDQLHLGARKAHEAARCATEQGKFCAYYDVLYANAPKANPENLKACAQDVGLDPAAFDQCHGLEGATVASTRSASQRVTTRSRVGVAEGRSGSRSPMT